MVLITGKKYDTLKYIAQIVLPALGTLYFALAGIWNLAHADEVVGTIVAVDTFLGVVLQLSSNAYESSGVKYDGVMRNHGEGTFSMDVNLTGNELEQRKELTLKVTPPPEQPTEADEVLQKVRKRKPSAKKKAPPHRPDDLDTDHHP